MEELTEDKKESERIGFGREFTRQAIERLVNQRDTLQKQYDDLRAKQDPRETPSLEMDVIAQQHERIARKIVETRDWYGIRVLEELEVESRRLKWLTVVLVALTAVLTIFTAFLVSGTRFP